MRVWSLVAVIFTPPPFFLNQDEKRRRYFISPLLTFSHVPCEYERLRERERMRGKKNKTDSTSKKGASSYSARGFRWESLSIVWRGPFFLVHRRVAFFPSFLSLLLLGIMGIHFGRQTDNKSSNFVDSGWLETYIALLKALI